MSIRKQDIKDKRNMLRVSEVCALRVFKYVRKGCDQLETDTQM